MINNFTRLKFKNKKNFRLYIFVYPNHRFHTEPGQEIPCKKNA